MKNFINDKLLESRVMFISDEINLESITLYQAQLMYLMSKSPSKITIYINSPGGSVYDGLGFIDLIEYAKNKGFIIRTVNIGKAFSMAAIILMSGSAGYRESLPNCSTMLHEISSENFGKTSSLKDDILETERLQNIINSIIEKNADSKLINMCERKDLWLSAKDSIDYKIIDKILID